MGAKLDSREVVSFRGLTVGLFGLGLLGVGCTANLWSRSSEIRNAATDLSPGDAITVILVESAECTYSPALEEDVAECVEDALEENYPTVRVVPADEFRQIAFPDLTAERSSPSNWIPRVNDTWRWKRLLKAPDFRERFKSLDIRYLIAVAVSEDEDPGEFNAHAAGDAGLAMLAVTWDRQHSAKMEATVVDLMLSRLAGSVSVEASDKSGFGLGILGTYGGGVPFPIVKLPFHEGRACRELGEGVAKFLAGESLPDETGTWPAFAQEEKEIGIWPAMAEEETTPTEEWTIPSEELADPVRGLANPDCTSPSTPACW